MKTYVGWFGDFTVLPEIDNYGEDFWAKIADKSYEPDTLTFLETRIDPHTDFMDIGAATGSMTIVAAKLGARVRSYEPIRKYFEIANSHIRCNADIQELIELRNEAISTNESELDLTISDSPSVLSSISYHQNDKRVIQVKSLVNEIQEFHKLERKLVLKVDIEGAEWKLLSDKATLEKLSQTKATVLLAIHPGFNRPFRKLPLGLTFLSKKFWQIQNAVVAYRLFKGLSSVAKIKRTSLDPVNSPKKFLLLMFGGYFEFILEFNKSQ